MRLPLVAAIVFALALPGATQAKDALPTMPVPPSGVMGVTDTQLDPEFWVQRLQSPDAMVLDAQAIQAQNARLFAEDATMHDLGKLPASISKAQVMEWLNKVSERPTKSLYDVNGQAVPSTTIDAAMSAMALETLPENITPRYGLVVRRAALRALPTDLRVFTSKGDTDIDRFQESAEFPGTPVAILHASRDGRWLFVLSPRYGAWIRADAVAEGDAKTVLDYAAQAPYRVVTAATVHTVYTREQPEVSELQLDMGARLPVDGGLAPDKPVNGQSPYAAYTLRMPVRGADGKLAFAPALVQRNKDTRADYLPLTQANIIRQAFKFLGERYGWGHDYDGRDCSGFVSDVYKSMGVWMPRNTSAQAVSPALQHQLFNEKTDHATREKAVDALQPGDLIYIPGHVMMMIGRIEGEPYVIHDTGGMSYRDGSGKMHHVKLNAVSVTPLRPMLFNDHQNYVDRMTSIVHIR